MVLMLNLVLQHLEIDQSIFFRRTESRGRVRKSSSHRCHDSHKITGGGLLAPAIINQANIKLTDEEEDLFRLGPKFIFNDPHTAAQQRTIELAVLKRKIQKRFFDRKVSPGRPVDQFIVELDLLL